MKYFSPDDVEIKSEGKNRYTLSTREYPNFLEVQKVIKNAIFSGPRLQKFFWEKFKLAVVYHSQKYWFD